MFEKSLNVVEKEQRYETLFETMALGVVYQNVKGEIEEANPAAERILGLSLDQMMGRKSIDPRWRSIREDGSEFPGDEHPTMVALKTGKPVQNVVMGIFNSKINSNTWININAIPQFKPGEKKPYQVYATFEDITEQKKYIEQLEKQNTFIQTILEKLPIGLATNYIDSGETNYINKKFEEIYGWPANKLTDVSEFFKLVFSNPDYRKQMQTKILKDIHSGDPDRMHWENMMVTHQDGSQGIVSAMNIPLSEQNLMVSIVWDVTERQKAEKALKESEALYRHLFEAESDAIFLIENESGQILAANQAASSLYGYDLQELLAIKNTNLSAEPDETRRVTETTPIIEDNVITIALRYHRKKDGTVFPVEITGRFFEWEGKDVHIEAVRDITDRIKSEEQIHHEHDLFEQITETSPIGITMVNKDGHILFANKRAEEIFLLEKDKITQKDYNAPEWQITDYEGNPFPEEMLPFVQVKKYKKPVFNVQHAIQLPDGNRHYLSINATPLFDENGKFESIIAAIEDVTEKKLTEQKSLLHQQKYEKLFNTMIDGYALHEIICDKKGKPVDYRYIDVNPAFEKMTGLKKENILGKTVLEVIPGTEKYWIETYGKVALTGEPIQFENYAASLDKYFDVTSFSPQKGQFVTIFVDITDKVIIQQEKEKHQEKYEQLFNSMLDGYALHEIIYDKKGKPMNFRYLDINPAYEKMTSLKRENVIGATILDIDQGKETGWRIETFGQVVITGKPIQYQHHSKELDKYFEVTAFRSQKNQFAIILVDISDQKKAELALEESQRILQESQKVAQLGHFKLDIVSGNWEGSEVLDQIMGIDENYKRNFDNLKKFIHPDFLDEISDHYFNRILKGLELFDKEYKIVRYDNQEERWIHGLGRLELNEVGEPMQMIGTIQDITKTKKVQLERENLIHELENKNAELERFTYTVSHDLKSPIVTIQGFIGVLTQDIKNKRYQHLEKYTDFISDAAHQMEHLLKDLLELSRIGRVINPSLTISMNEIVKNTITLLNENIKRSKVKIEVQTEMPSVYVDSVRMQEVMNNLVENAIKFMGDNENPLIQIGSKSLKSEYQFFVKDNGIGVESKYHSKIFGLFDQLNKKFEGTGVGLSLVKRIIEFHGGHIWVESEGENKGAIFYFTLPIKN